MNLALNPRHIIRESRGDRIYAAIVYSLLAILLVAYIYPLYFIVIASISEPNAVWNGEVILLPSGFSLVGYQALLSYDEMWLGYANTIFYTGAGLVFNLTLTMMGAYALSRPEMMLRGALMKLFTFTMFFGGGLIPTYLLIQDLGLLNTRWVLILPGAVNAYNFIIARSFLMKSIPEDLHEAAVLDGCSETRYLIRVILPLSTAIIGVLALYYGAAHWNAYFGAMIYLRDRSKFPLQLILREILNVTTSSTMYESAGSEAEMARLMRIAESVKYCSIVVASIPVMVAYPFVQRMFIKGVMIGSIKG